MKICPTCDGEKEIDCINCGGTGEDPETGSLCSDCNGNKRDICPTCDGGGEVTDEWPMLKKIGRSKYRRI